MYSLLRFVLVSSLLVATLSPSTVAGYVTRTRAVERENASLGSEHDEKSNPSKVAQQATGLQERTVIIVNGRELTGPNSAAQVRGGRLFLPVATIARALG